MHTSLKNRLFGFTSICLLVLTGACTAGEVGSKSRPFHMSFVPNDNTEAIENAAIKMQVFFEKRLSQKMLGSDTGFYVKTSVPTSYVALVESFGTNRADFAAINTYGYVMLKDVKKYPAEAVLIIGRGAEGLKTYKAQFIARADSGINSIKDFEGKKIAYVEPASVSGFLLPKAMLEKANIKPKEHVFANRHDNVVTMVYTRKVDVGATYYSPPTDKVVDGKTVHTLNDARRNVLTQFPDVEEKVKIVAFSDEIPNEPWVFRTNIFKDAEKQAKLKAAIQDSMIEYVATPEGKEILSKLYNISSFAKGTDDDLASVRALFKDFNFDK